MKNEYGFSPIYLIIFILITVVLGGVFYYAPVFRKSITHISPIKTVAESPSNTSLSPVYIGNYDVVVKVNADSPCNTNTSLSHCKSDIYLKEKTTGNEIYILTTNDVVYKTDSRVPQYRDGYIFLIKRTGNDEYPSDDWTDELWVYTDKDKGHKIYDSKGLTFSVNHDGSLVALLLYDGDMPTSNSVTILSRNSDWQSKKYTIEANKCSQKAVGVLALEKWQKNPNEIWGVYSGGLRITGCFWRLNPETSLVHYYAIDKQPFFALNTDKAVALYVDKPQFLDVDSHKKWLSTHKSYNLFLHSLENNRTTKITTFPADFDLKSANWISPTQLNYEAPNGPKTFTLSNQ